MDTTSVQRLLIVFCTSLTLFACDASMPWKQVVDSFRYQTSQKFHSPEKSNMQLYAHKNPTR